MGDSKRAIIFDVGSGWLKVGSVDSPAPSKTVPLVIGESATGEMLGFEAINLGGLNWPNERGIAKDRDDFRYLWEYGFDSIKESAVGSTIAMILPCTWNKSEVEWVLDTMFNKLMVSKCQIFRDCLMVARNVDKSTCLVVDIGDGVTTISPIIDKQYHKEGLQIGKYGGRDMTYFMREQILKETKKGVDLETVRLAKEDLCFVSMDYEADMADEDNKSVLESHYTAANGQEIILSLSRYMAPEILFNPKLSGRSGDGLLPIHELIQKSIKLCPEASRSKLLTNIVLTGGTSQINSLEQRLLMELEKLKIGSVDIITPSDPPSSVWCGAENKINNKNFKQWVISEEFDKDAKAAQSKILIDEF